MKRVVNVIIMGTVYCFHIALQSLMSHFAKHKTGK